MHRLLAFFAALVLTSLTVTSACTAAPTTRSSFLIEPSRDDGRVQATFRKAEERRNSWNSSFDTHDLAGLDLAALRAAGTRPIRFALLRESGRLDCAGSGGNALARGECTFTPDAGFLQLLDRRGIGRPDEDEMFGLVAVDVRRDLIEAIADSRYPTPSVDDLIALSALGVDRGYIAGLAGAGYRPADIGDLIQFKALAVTPEYISGFARLGYASLPASEIVQLKALDVTADYIAGFERIGYGRLPAGQLVQLKALGVTPDWVAGFQGIGYRRLPVSKLVELKALGITPAFIRSMRDENGSLPDEKDLTAVRAHAR